MSTKRPKRHAPDKDVLLTQDQRDRLAALTKALGQDWQQTARDVVDLGLDAAERRLVRLQRLE